MRVLWLSLWLLGISSSVQAMPDNGLSGEWRGQWAGENPVDVVLTVSIGSGEFHAEFAEGERTLPRTRFTRGPREGVYEGNVPGGIMDWLSLGSGPNPLEGKPLAWARTDQQGELNIYRFELAVSGDFELTHMHLKQVNDELELHLQRSGVSDKQSQLTARLSRQ